MLKTLIQKCFHKFLLFRDSSHPIFFLGIHPKILSEIILQIPPNSWVSTPVVVPPETIRNYNKKRTYLDPDPYPGYFLGFNQKFLQKSLPRFFSDFFSRNSSSNKVFQEEFLLIFLQRCNQEILQKFFYELIQRLS